MKKLASAVAFFALFTAAGSSSAQEIKFGEKGTLAIHAATGSPMLDSGALARGSGGLRLGATPTLGFQSSTYHDPNRNCPGPACEKDKYEWTSFYLNPRLHYFVIENLSIGGELLFATFSGTQTQERNGRRVETDIDVSPTGFGIMPLVGYNIRITDKFSIWPHGGIGFRRFTWEYPGTDSSDTWWFFNADVPFMLNLAPHFSIGAGPGATFTLSHERKNRTPVGTFEEEYGFTQWRWFNAHLIGYF